MISKEAADLRRSVHLILMTLKELRNFVEKGRVDRDRGHGNRGGREALAELISVPLLELLRLRS
jgi:hypothetical protein